MSVSDLDMPTRVSLIRKDRNDLAKHNVVVFACFWELREADF